MEIKDIEISKLKFAEYNPREITEKDFEALKNSIKEFGFVEPVVVNSDFTIVGGHMRVRAAQVIGIKSVPCYFVDLNKNKEKVLNIALNKISGDWDYDKLTGLLSELEQLEGVDISLTGFDDVEIGNIFDEYRDNEIIEDEVPEVQETDIKTGDLFQLDKHRLQCGDAMKEEDVIRLMNSKKADMIFTDPPYGMNLKPDWSKIKFKKEFKMKLHRNKWNPVIGDNKDFNPQQFFELFNYCQEQFWWGADYYSNKLLKNGSWFVWDKRVEENMDKIFGSNFELCWSKQKHKREIIRIIWSGVFGTQFEPDKDKARKHPTQKPVLLCKWFINKFSKENQIILDLFGGSGSTLIACEQTNRICYMMEIEPIYCQVIIDRWEKLVNKKAIKL